MRKAFDFLDSRSLPAEAGSHKAAISRTTDRGFYGLITVPSLRRVVPHE